jgi:hypothetical protein
MGKSGRRVYLPKVETGLTSSLVGEKPFCVVPFLFTAMILSTLLLYTKYSGR